ncbi:general transcriptional corepressor trfA [Copidosoma floridanum]|uniref:general transcriptional corepressor trfA n=1 Tax=Copidosoma floridanum TaxID=29053 RepID=UPI000C6F5D58|nr:general transcriptional corepressor trfA [Copidosoma floridanum]
METEELTKLVDDIYKNILDKFNPGARQLINAGKAYLKALHGAAAASKVYVDALSRLARQAQLGTWGGSQDVGSALMRIVEVYKEIQEQEINILKAFYVDLLVPLETNLEKDTKVVQSEQKKFLQQHKTRSETYSKAAATMKKQRKKSRGASKSGLAMDKELKNMQILEEEKSKLDAFCEQSLKNAMTQERRRYGFVLERQCSLAKHYASFHEVALAALHPSVDEWREIAATREYLPQSVEDMFASRLRQVSFWPEDDENGGSELTMSSQLRKTRSMDSSCLELRLGPPQSQSVHAGLHHGQGSSHLPAALSRARSEANLHASTLSLGPEVPDTPPRPRSMAPVSRNSGVSGGLISSFWGETPLARALFAYLSSGENQLSFHEGDLIALMGDRQKGWQFGENLRTQSSGWFPLAYTEIMVDEAVGSPNHSTSNGGRPSNGAVDAKAMPPNKPPPSRPPMPNNNNSNGNDESMNGGSSSNGIHDVNNGTLTSNNSSAGNASANSAPKSNNSSHGIVPASARQAKSIRPTGTLPTMLGGGGRRVQPPVPPVPPPQAVTSLHSSNDSGFSNEPPVQPDIDYSDDEAMSFLSYDCGKAANNNIINNNNHNNNNNNNNNNNKDDSKIIGSNDSKDWENDSWKTIPRDDKSWHHYRSSMTEYWSDASVTGKNEQTNGKSGRHDTEERRNLRNSESEPAGPTKKERKQQHDANNQKNEYENTRAPARNSDRGKFSANEDRNSGRSYSRRNDRDEDRSRYERRDVETEDDEIEVEVDVEEEEDESYNVSMEYRSEKYENKKYYENHNGNDRRSDYRGDNDSKYDNEKTSDSSSSRSSDSEEESTMPETGRKVEQIAQKLEQTAQKYAREHSPPKFMERRNMDYSKSTLERPHDDTKSTNASYDKYEREIRNGRPAQRPPSSSDRYTDKSLVSSRQSTLTYDRERSYDKNQERKRVSSRGPFERPRPPSQEAPERPTDQQLQQRDQQRYRERRYSEKEDIYGETTITPPIAFSNDPMLVDKDRGYESNFETKLERTKVLERHGFSRTARPAESHNDSNNNNVKVDSRKPLVPRQSTALGHLIQTGRGGFDLENKSPKLVKRTKSFWRFRRDSEVLEGMALWQHRSLVDIPKMLKKDAKLDKSRELNESRKSGSSGSSPGPSHRSLERKNSDSTITNERINGVEPPMPDEPKPAERVHLPDKSMSSLDYFDDPSPTPAERPKNPGRGEYRNSRHYEDQRSYFVGNVSRKAIIENERKRSMEAKRNMIVAELKENNQAKRNERRKKAYGEDDDDDDDGIIVQRFTETEASDEESTYSCIIVKDQAVSEKTLLPRTKLRRDSERGDRNKKTCGPWYDLWGVDQSVIKKKKKKQQ